MKLRQEEIKEVMEVEEVKNFSSHASRLTAQP
jgi:hypothetical protein